MASDLPMDLVMGEILTRLPVKSLIRFKCVSKIWLWLIRSKYFTNRFLTVPSPRLYMCLSDHSGYRNNSVVLSLAPPHTSSIHSFVVDQDLTIPRMGGYLLQNLRGFMCYIHSRKPWMYNPATRQIVTLPPIKANNMHVPRPAPGRKKKIINYYFGHDPVSDHYIVVCLISLYVPKPFQMLSSENWVFVIKAGGGGSWKKVAPTTPDFCHHMSTNGGLCLNGIIYYLAWIDRYNCVVVSFDIRSEEFSMIQVPRRDNEPPPMTWDMTLVEYSGKVTLFDQTNLRDKGMVALWTVEDIRSKEWSCKNLVLQPSQLHLVTDITFMAKGTTQTGKVLLIPEELISPFHFLSYDLQRNDMRKIEIKGIPDHWFSIDKDMVYVDLMFMDQSESVIHLKT